MSEDLFEIPVILMFLGVMILLSQPIRALCYPMRVPPMVGFILLGVIVAPNLGIVGSLEPTLNRSVEILAEVGIVVLLFRIGLESNITRLVSQLRHAIIIWLPNVFGCGANGIYFDIFLARDGIDSSIVCRSCGHCNKRERVGCRLGRGKQTQK